MHDAPLNDKIKPSKAFPKLMGFRNGYCTSGESELVSKLRIYINDLGHPATLHTMYGITPYPIQCMTTLSYNVRQPPSYNV